MNMISAADDATTHYLVFDIETAPVDDRAPDAGRRRSRKDAGAALHDIRAAAVLAAREDRSGRWTIQGPRSWWQPKTGEFHILMAIEEELHTLGRLGGTLIGFNSIRHDLPTIRKRAARHLMMDLEGWNAASRVAHRDLMTNGIGGADAPWVGLEATCRSLWIPTDHAFAEAALATIEPARRKCETDVCAEFVLLLYTLAMERADLATLHRGWTALADHMHSQHQHRPHLIQFAAGAEAALGTETGAAVRDRM